MRFVSAGSGDAPRKTVQKKRKEVHYDHRTRDHPAKRSTIRWLRCAKKKQGRKGGGVRGSSIRGLSHRRREQRSCAGSLHRTTRSHRAPRKSRPLLFAQAVGPRKEKGGRTTRLSFFITTRKGIHDAHKNRTGAAAGISYQQKTMRKEQSAAKGVTPQ